MNNPKNVIYDIYKANLEGDVSLIADICKQFQEYDYYKALDKGYLSTIKKWLEFGIDINNAHPISGVSPLMATVKALDADLTSEFIKAGANINQLDSHERPVFYYLVDGIFSKPSSVILGEYDEELIATMTVLLEHKPDLTNYIDRFIFSIKSDDGELMKEETKLMITNHAKAYFENSQLNELINNQDETKIMEF